MLFYTFAFVVIRTFIQYVHDDYINTTHSCKELLDKATAETIPDIRSAYFLKLIDIDNTALQNTFEKFYIGFLASESTYASEEEIITHACKMPNIISEFLSWTAGVTPLLSIYILYLMYVKVKDWGKSKLAKEKFVEENKVVLELTKPPSRPPIIPLMRRRQSTFVHLDQTEGIRHRKQEKNTQQPKQSGILEQLTNLSPRLKQRIFAKGKDAAVDV